MSDDDTYLRLLRGKADQLAGKSPGMESMPAREAVALDPAAPPAARSESASLEAIIRWYRPVLAVADDHFVRSVANPDGSERFPDPNQEASKALLDALEQNRSMLDPAIRSVGRIELVNNAQYPWVGTGWIIDSELGSDIIVTNGHVAEKFGKRSGAGFLFQPGIPDFSVKQSARVDFREETGSAPAREFPITDIIWISDIPGIDMAILRVARTAGIDRIDPPIRLLPGEISRNRMLAVIGFPGSNDGYDPEPFRRLFGPVTGKKRFSPGFYSGVRSSSITYDCSTLPGSSGSVVIDVTTGRAVGLHFAGTAFDTNYGVSASELARVIAQRPWHPELPSRPQPVDAPAAGSSPARDTAGGGPTPGTDGLVRIVLPIEITFKLGSPSQAAAGSGVTVTAGAAAAPKSDRASAEAAARKTKERFAQEPSVLVVKADYLFRDGMITDDFGVVVGVATGTDLAALRRDIGPRVDGVEVSVEIADPETIAARELAIRREAFGGRTARYERDLTERRFDLSPVTDDMKITLHVSPEAGWPVLKEFLAQDDCNALTIGMYHMTAPHVVKAIQKIAARPGSRITLTLDRQRGDADEPDDTAGDTKADDIPEKKTLRKLESIAGKRFKWASASLGADGLFASAYHIKAAVWSRIARGRPAEDRVVWISSGNWQSSNQAPIDTEVADIGSLTWDEVASYNREWHALVAHKGLAATFRHHLEQDYVDNAAAAEREAPMPRLPDVLVPEAMVEEAPRPRAFRAFAPEVINGRLKVQPLLTPDNYPDVIANLIGRARERVLIENQSFSLWSDIEQTPEHFLKILRAVADRQKQGLDVRIIFRSGFGKERETLRQIKRFGLKAGPDHVRYFDKCHTKGIVIDREIAVLGSQNWTAAGTGPNRDASLLVWHPKANEYFARLFEYDWRQLARKRARTIHEGAGAPVRFVPAGAEAQTPHGYRRISLGEFLGET